MDYGSLVRDAWGLAWRHRFLWVLGLFTGTGVGSCGFGGGNTFRFPSGGQSANPPSPGATPAADAERAGAAIVQWIAAHPLLIVAAVVVFLAVVLMFLIISLIAQGGMTEATVGLSEGRAVSAGEAWRAGLRFFWRFFGLDLLLIGAFVVVAAIVAALVVAALAAGVAGQPGARTAVIILAVLLGLALLVVAIPTFIAISVIVAFAKRSIVVDDVGPVAGLGAGWRLVRANVGASLLLWLINLGLGIAAGIALLFGLVVAVLGLGIVGVAFWALFGFTAPTVAYIALALVALIAAIWLLQGFVNAFLWSYWSLAFLRLRGVAAPVAFS